MSFIFKITWILAMLGMVGYTYNLKRKGLNYSKIVMPCGILAILFALF